MSKWQPKVLAPLDFWTFDPNVPIWHVYKISALFAQICVPSSKRTVFLVLLKVQAGNFEQFIAHIFSPTVFFIICKGVPAVVAWKTWKTCGSKSLSSYRYNFIKAQSWKCCCCNVVYFSCFSTLNVSAMKMNHWMVWKELPWSLHFFSKNMLFSNLSNI